jgi:linoleoyl-CoA desaturase
MAKGRQHAERTPAPGAFPDGELDGPARSRRALREIRAEIRGAGLDRKAPGRVALELLVHVTLLAAGLAGFFAAEPWPSRAVWLCVAMLGHVGVTTNAHTWTHHAASARRTVNDALAFFTGNLVSGISYTFWNDKHNRRHHGFPNVKGIDPDHDFAPFFALSEADLTGRGRVGRLYYRWQWVFAPVLLAVMLPRMKAEGFVHAVRSLRRGEERRIAVLDVLVQLASIAVWWGVPLWLGSLFDAVLLNAFREISLSYALFLIFAPAHIPRAAAFFARPVEGDVVLRQTATTLDYEVGRLAAFFLSGLQYQIEHHLLIDVPHVHYAKIQPIVEGACRRHGYPYRVLSWGQGLRETFAVFRSPKAVALPPARMAGAGAGAVPELGGNGGRP